MRESPTCANQAWLFAHDERRGGRPHAAQIGIRLRLGEDPRVRARERVAQRRGDVVGLAAEVLRLDRLAGEARCGCAAAMSAHAVGDDEQPSAGMAARALRAASCRCRSPDSRSEPVRRPCAAPPERRGDRERRLSLPQISAHGSPRPVTGSAIIRYSTWSHTSPQRRRSAI